MASVDSYMEYETFNEESVVEERERLLGLKENVHMRLSCASEMETVQSLPEHMLPVGRDEQVAVDHGRSASALLQHHDPGVTVHCHGPATAEDRVARNQLIAISVLCFFFMVAEVVG